MTNHFHEPLLLWSKFKENRKLVSETPDADSSKRCPATCLELLFSDVTPCSLPPSFILVVEVVGSSETFVNLC
jgi:hypothetical protein